MIVAPEARYRRLGLGPVLLCAVFLFLCQELVLRRHATSPVQWVVAATGLPDPFALGFLGTSTARGCRRTIQPDLRTMKSAIAMYRLDTGRLPDALEDLVHEPDGAEGWNGPYLEGGAVPPDLWNNPYEYVHPSSSSHGYDIVSLGADGAYGGEGVDRDLWMSDLLAGGGE